MYRRILVALDGSELAERALPNAQQVLLTSGPTATLHLVRVVDVPYAPWSLGAVYIPDTALDEERADARTYLDEVRGRFAADQHVHVDVLTGSIPDALLAYEESERIDLMIVCSHGRTGFARLALGSVAERLIRDGRAPVLLVHGFGPTDVVKHALAPLDGSAKAEQALLAVDQLTGPLVQEVLLLRVIDRPEQSPDAEAYLREIARRLDAQRIPATPMVQQGSPAQRIVEVANGNRLVVMTTHGGSHLPARTLGVVANAVAHSQVPAVLFVRPT